MASPVASTSDLLVSLKTNESNLYPAVSTPVPTLTTNSEDSALLTFAYRNQLMIASEYVTSRLGYAQIAIVLGSGLGDTLPSRLKNAKSLPYSTIPFLPQPTVRGHSGQIIVGDLEGQQNVGSTEVVTRRVMCFSGRLHPYEGVPMHSVVFCVRLAKFCGCHTLLLTNSSGGCIENQKPGSVVIVTDSIRDVYYSILNHSANDAMYGSRHPRGDRFLDKTITQILGETAEKEKFTHYYGNYWWCSGPIYETAMQIKYLMRSGGHAVGMSTVPEMVAAANIGLRVGVLAMCTNVAAGLDDEELDHKVVVANAKKIAVAFGDYVQQCILNFPNAARHDNKYPVDPNEVVWDERMAPEVHLLCKADLYNDVCYVRKYLESILHLQSFDEDDMIAKSRSLPSATGGNKEILGDKTRVLNSRGPIPVWVIHSPFVFQIAKYLDCPVSFPLKLLPGAASISLSRSILESVLTFGLYQGYMVVIVSNINLDGLMPTECEYLVNLLHGCLGHKNLYFTNLFMVFDANHIYSDRHEWDAFEKRQYSSAKVEESKNGSDTLSPPRRRFALIRDFVDFNGGLPFYPYPLLLDGKVDYAAGAINTEDPKLHSFAQIIGDACHLHKNLSLPHSDSIPQNILSMNTDSDKMLTDDEVEDILDVLDGKKKDTKVVNKPKVVNTSKPDLEWLDYGWWPGTHLPTRAEVTVSKISHCPVLGITCPLLPGIARQLGHCGISIAFVGDSSDVNFVASDNITQPRIRAQRYDVSSLVIKVSESIVRTFKRNLIRSDDNSVNPNFDTGFSMEDFRRLRKCNLPKRPAPVYPLIFPIDVAWNCQESAAAWLQSKCEILKNKQIRNCVFTYFVQPFDIREKKAIFSLDLGELPYWRKFFCGGAPFTHFHCDSDNPFGWRLMVVPNSKSVKNEYFVLIAPNITPETAEFYKYIPQFWNLMFVLRVLSRCGVNNVVFLSKLFCTDNKQFKLAPFNHVCLLQNFVDCNKWNYMSGPNDDRLGPRFTPITEPMDGNAKFQKLLSDSKIDIPLVGTVHVPNNSVISTVSKKFYASYELQTVVSGLVPMLCVAQHMSLSKLCIGVTDYRHKQPLDNVKSWDVLLSLIESYLATE